MSVAGGELDTGRTSGEWAFRATVVATLILVPIGASFMIGACMSGRRVANAYVAALREERVDDARVLAAPEMQLEMQATPTAPASDPGKTLALVRAAKKVELDGMVQLGFGDGFVWFACFDGALDDNATFWIVLHRANGAWLVENVASAEPEMCQGGD
jgi:hypothetical protein